MKKRWFVMILVLLLVVIAGILFDMDSDIRKLEEKLLKYQRIKQGMMEDLLTGKVRLI